MAGPVVTTFTFDDGELHRSEVEDLGRYFFGRQVPWRVRDGRLRILEFHQRLRHLGGWLPENAVGRGEQRLHEVYLLGSLLPEPVDWPAQSRRLAVQASHERMYDLEAWLPEGSVGRAEPVDSELAAVRRGTGTGAGPGARDGAPRWPLAEPLASAPSVGIETRCRTLTPAEVGTLRQAAGAASELSWVHDGVVFSTRPRQLLPDEADCESVAADRADR